MATQPFAVERAEAPRRLAITRGLMLAPILAALVLGAGIVLSVRHAVAPAPSPPAAAAPPSAEPPAPPLAPALGTAPLEPSLGLGTSGPVADHALSPTELAEAEACLSRGEPDCAIEILRRGSSAVDLARLVEVYASLGRTLESRAAMERFVRRHPRAPEAVGYRARLAGE